MKVFLTFKRYFKSDLVSNYSMPIKSTVQNFERLAFAMNCLIFYYEIFAGISLKVFITSVWRPKEYNKLIGGSKNSKHTTAEAIDIMPQNLESFIFFLRSPVGLYALKVLGLYFYVGYTKKGIRYFHFQIKKTPNSNKLTHQFYTKKYPKKYII